MASATGRVLLLVVLLVEIAVLLDVSLGEPSASSSSNDYDTDGLVIDESAISTSSAVASASFAKTFTVWPPKSDLDVAGIANLYIYVPGRVFISYVDYESAGSLVNSSTLMGINVYSDLLTLVGLVAAVSLVWNRVSGTELSIGIRDPSGYGPLNGSLLVEIAVFRRNQLRHIRSEPGDFGVEIIIDDGVARSRTDSPKFTTDSDGYLEFESGSGSNAFEDSKDSFEINVFDSTTLYFLSPTTELNLYRLQVSGSEVSKVYIEAGDIATSVWTKLFTFDSCNIVAFIDSIRAESVALSPYDNGTLCLVVSDTFEMGEDQVIDNEENIALPGQTGGLEVTGKFSCAKAQIPDRIPRDIKLMTTVLTPSNEPWSSQSSSSRSSSNLASATKLPPVVAVVVGIALTMIW